MGGKTSKIGARPKERKIKKGERKIKKGKKGNYDEDQYVHQ